MADNQLFADWVTGDLITAAKLNQMKNDVIPWSQAGEPNGVATLDAAGKLVQPRRVLGVHIPASWDTIDTTATYDAAPVVGIVDIPAVTYPRTAIILGNLGLMAVDTDVTYVRGVFAYSTDGGSTWNRYNNPVHYPLNASEYISYPISPRKMWLAAGTAYKIGIQAGNGTSSDGPTVRVYGYPYSSLVVMEVDY